MLANIGLSLRIPLLYIPNPSIPKAARHAVDIAGALARGVLAPEDVGGDTEGEGVGDCTKHHCFTKAAYDESVGKGEEDPSLRPVSEGTGRAE